MKGNEPKLNWLSLGQESYLDVLKLFDLVVAFVLLKQVKCYEYQKKTFTKTLVIENPGIGTHQNTNEKEHGERSVTSA